MTSILHVEALEILETFRLFKIQGLGLDVRKQINPFRTLDSRESRKLLGKIVSKMRGILTMHLPKSDIGNTENSNLYNC